MIVGGAFKALAGPPFLTDDPEPVDYQNWEFYIASMHTQTADGWSGTAPHIEVNYGVDHQRAASPHRATGLQRAVGRQSHYGYGDTELGVKFRFIQETDHMPQVGIFPLLEVPTGSESEGLGSGHWQAFLPVWAAKELRRLDRLRRRRLRHQSRRRQRELGLRRHGPAKASHEECFARRGNLPQHRHANRRARRHRLQSRHGH